MPGMSTLIADTRDHLSTMPCPEDSFLSFELALSTAHELNLFCPTVPDAVTSTGARQWLVRGELLGGIREVDAPEPAWAMIQDVAASIPPRLWPMLLKRELTKQAWEVLVNSLGMPGAIAKSRTVTDPYAVTQWAAWNREALRHRLIYGHPFAPDEDVLHSSTESIEISPRFREEAVSFLALPAEFGVRLAPAEMSAILWKLAKKCRALDVIAMRRVSLTTTAGLRTEEDYEDLRALVWRGNTDAQVVLDALEKLDEIEAAAVVELDEVTSELEFLVRDRRMSKKERAIGEAKRIAEALLPAA